MRLKRRFAGADQVVMDVRPGRIALYAGLAIVAAAVLWIVIEAAGRPVALAVAITAIVVLAASYVWFGVLVVRSLGDLDATKRKPLPRARAAIPMMFGMPLVIIAAHPWGPASAIVGTGAVFVCQSLFTFAMTIALLIVRRRVRQR